MTTLNLTKKSVLNAAIVIAEELASLSATLEQVNADKLADGKLTSKDKKELQAIKTKHAYFQRNVVGALNNDKLAGVFYYAIKNTKQDPEMFFREAMENSYSLEKLVYLIESVQKKRCVYSLADMSASRVFVLVDMIKDGLNTFTLQHVFDEMNAAKKAIIESDPMSTLRLDTTYTQASQLVTLFERVGLVTKIKGSGQTKNGSIQYSFNKNDFYDYLAEMFTA